MTEVKSAYSAVGTESLCNTDTFRLQKVNLVPKVFSSRPIAANCDWILTGLTGRRTALYRRAG